MKDLLRCLSLLVMLLAHTCSLETGIDKGTLHCSREKGNDILHAEKGDHGYIVSGGYPGNYSTGGKKGLWCQIHIKLCSTCRLKLHFEELSFAQCDVPRQGKKGGPNKDWCYDGCDHIHIHEVDPPYSEVTHRDYFLGDEGDHYTSISGHMKVRHCVGQTSLEEGKRFKIAYQVMDKTELHQGVVSQYGDSTGYLTSPNFPHGYALNGETFTYMIQNLDPYGHVRLTFDDWDIAPETKVKVYDGFSENSPHKTLERYSRPVLVSESNTLVIVMSTGKQSSECCYHTGFKAHYVYVSEDEWRDRPDPSCSEAHPMQGGGIIAFTGATSAGWLQYGRRNSLEIRNGIHSEAPLLARFTARNLTDISMSYRSQEGFYLRLRGGFYSTDKLSFMYTAVKNVTGDGEGCPGYFDFLCRTLFCIDQELMCDGVDHCGDGSDESPAIDCSVSDLWKHSFKWSMPYIAETTLANAPACVGILCGRTCIKLEQICDGVPDCDGREDEDNCAQPVTPENGGRRQTSDITVLIALFVVCWHMTFSSAHR